MLLSKYAKEKGYSLDQFHKLQADIKAAAAKIIEGIQGKFAIDSGMYYKTSEIIPEHNDLTPYLIQELKAQGMEFIENGEYWRF